MLFKIKAFNTNSTEGAINQKLRLFKRGNAMSGTPSWIGTMKFPNPPIKMGMATQKTMIKPWAVTTLLYML